MHQRGCIDVLVVGWMYWWVDGCTGEWMDGRMDGSDGWMDGWIRVLCCLNISKVIIAIKLDIEN